MANQTPAEFKRRIEIELTLLGTTNMTADLAAVQQSLYNISQGQARVAGASAQANDVIDRLAKSYLNANYGVNKFSSALNASLGFIEKTHRGLVSISQAAAGLLSPFNAIAGLVGADGLGLGKGIQIWDQFNRQTLVASSQFAKYGIGTGKVQQAMKDLSNQLGITNMDSLKLLQTYEKGFNYISIQGGIDLMKNLKNAVGGNVEAMQDLLGTVSAVAQKYPSLEVGITRLNDTDKERLSTNNELLVLTGRTSLAEAKRFQDYLTQNKQIEASDDAKKSIAEQQVDSLNQLRKTFEMISMEIGKTLMPYLRDFSKFVQQTRNTIMEWVPAISKIAAAFGVVTAVVGALLGPLRLVVTLLGSVGNFGAGLIGKGGTGLSGSLGNLVRAGGRFVYGGGVAGTAGGIIGGAAGIAAGVGVHHLYNQGVKSLTGVTQMGDLTDEKIAKSKILKTVLDVTTGLSGIRYAESKIFGQIGSGAGANAVDSINVILGRALSRTVAGAGVGAGVGAAIGSVGAGVGAAPGAAIGGIIGGVGSFFYGLKSDISDISKIWENARKNAEAMKVAGEQQYNTFKKYKEAEEERFEKLRMDLENLHVKDDSLRYKGVEAGQDRLDAQEAYASYKKNAMVKGKLTAEDNEILADLQTKVEIAQKEETRIGKILASQDSLQISSGQKIAEDVVSGRKDNYKQQLQVAASGASVASQLYGGNFNLSQINQNKNELKQQIEGTSVTISEADRQKLKAIDVDIAPELKGEAGRKEIFGAVSQVDSTIGALQSKKSEITEQSEKTDDGEEKIRLLNQAKGIEKEIVDWQTLKNSLAKQHNTLLEQQNPIQSKLTAMHDQELAFLNEKRMVLESHVELMAQQVHYLDILLQSGQTTGAVDPSGIVEAVNTALSGVDKSIKDRQENINIMAEKMAALKSENAAQKEQNSATIDKFAPKLGVNIPSANFKEADYYKTIQQLPKAGLDQHDSEAVMNALKENVRFITEEDTAQVTQNIEILKLQSEQKNAEAEKLRIRMKVADAYQAERTVAQDITSIQETQIQLIDNLGAGFSASAQARMQAAQSMDAIIGAYKKERELLLQQYDDAKKRGAPEEELLGIKDLILKKELEIVNTQSRQAQMLKVLRDGYLSAINAMNAGAGTWGKLVIDQNKNTGFAIKNFKILMSMGVGGMGHGMDSRGARQASGFSVGGFYGPNPQEMKRPDFFNGGGELANEVRDRTTDLMKVVGGKFSDSGDKLSAASGDLRNATKDLSVLSGNMAEAINALRGPNGQINKGGAGAFEGTHTQSQPSTPGSPSSPQSVVGNQNNTNNVNNGSSNAVNSIETFINNLFNQGQTNTLPSRETGGFTHSADGAKPYLLHPNEFVFNKRQMSSLSKMFGVPPVDVWHMVNGPAHDVPAIPKAESSNPLPPMPDAPKKESDKPVTPVKSQETPMSTSQKISEPAYQKMTSKVPSDQVISSAKTVSASSKTLMPNSQHVPPVNIPNTLPKNGETIIRTITETIEPKNVSSNVSMPSRETGGPTHTEGGSGNQTDRIHRYANLKHPSPTKKHHTLLDLGPEQRRMFGTAHVIPSKTSPDTLEQMYGHTAQTGSQKPVPAATASSPTSQPSSVKQENSSSSVIGNVFNSVANVVSNMLGITPTQDVKLSTPKLPVSTSTLTAPPTSAQNMPTASPEAANVTNSGIDINKVEQQIQVFREERDKKLETTDLKTFNQNVESAQAAISSAKTEKEKSDAKDAYDYIVQQKESYLHSKEYVQMHAKAEGEFNKKIAPLRQQQNIWEWTGRENFEKTSGNVTNISELVKQSGDTYSDNTNTNISQRELIENAIQGKHYVQQEKAKQAPLYDVANLPSPDKINIQIKQLKQERDSKLSTPELKSFDTQYEKALNESKDERNPNQDQAKKAAEIIHKARESYIQSKEYQTISSKVKEEYNPKITPLEQTYNQVRWIKAEEEEKKTGKITSIDEIKKQISNVKENTFYANREEMNAKRIQLEDTLDRKIFVQEQENKRTAIAQSQSNPTVPVKTDSPLTAAKSKDPALSQPKAPRELILEKARMVKQLMQDKKSLYAAQISKNPISIANAEKQIGVTNSSIESQDGLITNAYAYQKQIKDLPTPITSLPSSTPTVTPPNIASTSTVSIVTPQPKSITPVVKDDTITRWEASHPKKEDTITKWEKTYKKPEDVVAKWYAEKTRDPLGEMSQSLAKKTTPQKEKDIHELDEKIKRRNAEYFAVPDIVHDVNPMVEFRHMNEHFEQQDTINKEIQVLNAERMKQEKERFIPTAKEKVVKDLMAAKSVQGEIKKDQPVAMATQIQAIQKFHAGGRVKGPVGSDQIAVVQGGETVQTIGSSHEQSRRTQSGPVTINAQVMLDWSDEKIGAALRKKVEEALQKSQGYGLSNSSNLNSEYT